MPTACPLSLSAPSCAARTRKGKRGAAIAARGEATATGEEAGERAGGAAVGRGGGGAVLVGRGRAVAVGTDVAGGAGSGAHPKSTGPRALMASRVGQTRRAAAIQLRSRLGGTLAPSSARGPGDLIGPCPSPRSRIGRLCTHSSSHAGCLKDIRGHRRRQRPMGRRRPAIIGHRVPQRGLTVSDEPTVRLERQGSAATLMLNRPEALNAINAALVRDFGAACGELESDQQTRVVVLRG